MSDYSQNENKDKQQAFLALYEPIHYPFARFCQSRAYNSCDAKDLMSETILRAYENFDRLTNQDVFLYFLIGTATNILKSQWRRKKFRGVFRWLDATEKQADLQNPEISADVRLLYEALQKLPDAQREAVILFEISGFSLKQVQDIQQTSLSAVKSRIARGKERLARLLHDSEVLPRSIQEFQKQQSAVNPSSSAKAIYL